MVPTYHFILLIATGPSPSGTTFFKLPSGELEVNESEVDGMRRIVHDTLGKENTSSDIWTVEDVVSNWWRPNFESPQYPYIPPHCTHPKVAQEVADSSVARENNVSCAAKLQTCGKLYDNSAGYGPVIACLRTSVDLLSYTFNLHLTLN